MAVGGNRADVRKDSERGCVHYGTTETCHIDFQWSRACVCERACLLVCVHVQCEDFECLQLKTCRGRLIFTWSAEVVIG